MENKNDPTTQNKHTKSLDTLSSKIFQKIEKRYSLLNKEYSKLLKSYKRAYKAKEEIETRYFSAELFPRIILELECSRGHQTCIILSHKKGEPYYKSHSFTKAKGSSSYQSSDITSFRRFFDQIKKSKNRVFGPQNPFMLEHHIYGTFLAKEILFKEYNCVVVVSSNGFLHPSPDELELFDLSIIAIKPSLKKALSVDGKNEKNYQLLLALNNYPCPVVISHNENQIFSNKMAFEHEADRFFHLDNGYGLAIGENNSDLIITDLYHHQRVGLLGELLNTLKHELSNPLFGIELGAEFLSEGLDNYDSQSLALSIRDNSKRCLKIIDNFQNLYSNEDNNSEFCLVSLIMDTLKMLKSQTRGVDITLIHEQESLTVKTNPIWIGQIIFNLVINAVQAMAQDHTITPKIVISLSRCIESKKITVDIADNGPGVPCGLADKLFMAFVTSKKEGTGLGLSICKRLAEKNHGSISFKNNSPLPGATFSLNFPYGYIDH